MERHAKMKKDVIYRNRGGGNYLCMDDTHSDTTLFKNVDSGWTLTAHNVTLYDDGTIEWDYSTGRTFKVKPEAVPSCEEELTSEIKSKADIDELTDYEKFLRDQGWKYKTKETLQGGYDRSWKASHGIALTEEEFVTEAQGLYPSNYDEVTLRDVYAQLMEFVKSKKLTPSAIYRYAHFCWCLNKPDAIIAYQGERDKWCVNNCETEISNEAAVVEINTEWGFEASRIKIIGTPYYEATDWQFIRFNCAHMSWLWVNGNLYQTYE